MNDTSNGLKTAAYVAGAAVVVLLAWPLLRGLGGIVASSANLISDVEGKVKTVVDDTWTYAVAKPWHYTAEGASKVKQAGSWAWNHTFGYL